MRGGNLVNILIETKRKLFIDALGFNYRNIKDLLYKSYLIALKDYKGNSVLLQKNWIDFKYKMKLFKYICKENDIHKALIYYFCLDKINQTSIEKVINEIKQQQLSNMETN